MKKGVKITLSVIAGVLAVIIIFCGVCWFTSFGTVNIILRNVFSGSVKMPEGEWTGGKSYENVRYSEVSESDYLNLYVPDGVENPPLLIIVHGGGFIYNDCNSRQAKFMYSRFREFGYACASINYRLADEAIYPAAICDVKAAVRFLRANADKYGYDEENFIIWGESAGGYLATMVALCGEDDFNGVKYIGEGENPVSGKVHGLVDYYGIIDFDLADEDFPDSGVPMWLAELVRWEDVPFTTQWLGKDISELTKEELYAVSPRNYIDNVKGREDFFAIVCQGDADITVAHKQSERLFEQLEKAIGKDRTRFVNEKNFKHADDKFYTVEKLSALDRLIRSFL